MIDNPPWVDTLLTENWQELVASIEPDLLPLTVTSGKRVLKRRIAPDAESCRKCEYHGMSSEGLFLAFPDLDLSRDGWEWLWRGKP